MRVFLVQYLGLHPEDATNTVRRDEPGMVGFADVDGIVGRAESDLVSVLFVWYFVGGSADGGRGAVGIIAVFRSGIGNRRCVWELVRDAYLIKRMTNAVRMGPHPALGWACASGIQNSASRCRPERYKILQTSVKRREYPRVGNAKVNRQGVAICRVICLFSVSTNPFGSIAPWRVYQ